MGNPIFPSFHVFCKQNLVIRVLILLAAIKFGFWQSSSIQTDIETLLPELTRVDLKDYVFLKGSAAPCRQKNESEHLVVILVHSARHHFEYRQRIRDTWGSVHAHGIWRFRTVFMLGSNLAPTARALSTSQQIQEEVATHGDVIFASFHDSYRNMTVKHLMGYKWVAEHCPEARWVLKTDDDMFINPYALVKLFLEKQKRASKTPAPTHTFSAPTCMLCMEMRSKPQRRPGEKWAISVEEYSDPDYPPYCLGAAYVTTPDLIRRLLSVHAATAGARGYYFWIDDVFVTGILREIYNSLSLSLEDPSTPIMIDRINDVFDLQAGSTGRWNPSKVFYLIKEFDRVHFQSMSVYWNITQLNKRLEERQH